MGTWIGMKFYGVLLTAYQEGTAAGWEVEDYIVETGGAVGKGIVEAFDIDGRGYLLAFAIGHWHRAIVDQEAVRSIPR